MTALTSVTYQLAVFFGEELLGFTRLQTMHTVLKNSKTLENGCGSVEVRLRLIFQFTYVQNCIQNCLENLRTKFSVNIPFDKEMRTLFRILFEYPSYMAYEEMGKT